MTTSRPARPILRRSRVAALVLSVLAVPALAACGSSGHAGHTGGVGDTHVMPDGSSMTDEQMAAMGGHDGAGHDTAETDAEHAPAPGDVTRRGDGPTEAAGMICSLEVAQAVQRTFALATVPAATDAWQEPAYRCAYRLPAGTLRLSVADLDAGTTAAREEFRRTRAAVHDARDLQGVEALGLPSFESGSGRIGFLKDGRTLLVDASGVAKSDLPPGFDRMGAAYAVAAAVIACWTE